MSDPRYEDSGQPRPQVIDLEAEEIRSEPETPPPAAEEPRAESAEPAPPPPPETSPRFKQRGRGAAGWIVAALILGAIGGGWLYRDVLAQYLPSNEMRALKEQVAALEQNNSALEGEIAAVKQQADAAAQSASGASDAAAKAGSASAEQIAALTAQLGERLDKGDKRAAHLEEQVKAAAADLDAFRKSVSVAPPAPGETQTTGASPAGNAALAALAQRIDALEKDVASLKSTPGAGQQAGVTAALSQALSDLKAKVAAGTAYQPEYDRIARMVPAAPGLDVVASHAAEGLPGAKGLAQELRAAIPALPQPAPPPAEDDSYVGTLMKSLSGVISIRPIGETDWPAVAERAAGLAEAGDLTQAIAVIEQAEGEKPMSLNQWRERAAARLQLDAAVSQLSEAVLRQISALSGGAAQ